MRLASLFLGCFLLLTSGFAGCTRSARSASSPTSSSAVTTPVTPTAALPAPPTESKPTYAVRFERTPCMGKCPAFVLEIDADGRGRYEGRSFAPLEGNKELTFSAEVLRTIDQLTKEMNFQAMPEDKYGRGMMDAPSAIVSLRRPSGEIKTVKCTGMECPPELLALHKYLDRELRTALGVGGEEK